MSIFFFLNALSTGFNTQPNWNFASQMTLNDDKIVLAGNNNNNVEQMNKRCRICQV